MENHKADTRNLSYPSTFSHVRTARVFPVIVTKVVSETIILGKTTPILVQPKA